MALPGDSAGGDADDRGVAAGLAALRARFGPPEAPAAAANGGDPVFALSAGWRAGSTLLQRLLVSDPSVLVWGEPYDNSAPIRRLAEMLEPFDDAWPPPRSIVGGPEDIDPARWLANRYPHPHDLLGAHRAFLDRLFAEPAARHGFARWGLKTVRLDGGHAAYLRALYPSARILLLVRNPYDAFLSYRMLHDVRPSSYWWFHRWPDQPVSTAAAFGRLWERQARTFVAVADDIDALLVRFDALVDGSSVDEIAARTGLELQRSVLDTKVGGSAQQRRAPTPEQARLSAEEERDLRVTVGTVALELGYRGPSTGSGT